MQSVGDSIVLKNRKWSFSSAQVVSGFNFHIENSVPLYHQGHDLVLGFADFFLSSGSVCYDLGCATGRLTVKLADCNPEVLFRAVDVETKMLEQARQQCQAFANVELIHADITELEFVETDLIISYYTLQFIPPKLRQRLVTKIYNSLNVGSAFILFEKVYVDDAQLQDMVTLLHANAKLQKGYKPDEVLAKANSLKGVLKPRSSDENIRLLAKAGFSRVLPIMKYPLL